ncbi:MAG: class I SAM-dependent DNA methyltransferase [Spirochaetota bacterium]|nr:class I SAM-dependent DNA methyltransferase [Spirochaetota bacterium]
MNNFNDIVNFIVRGANQLRGPYKQAQYGKVILPMTVLRRLDCVLEPTKEKVLAEYEKHKDKEVELRERILNRAAGQEFHNTSKLDFQKLKGDSANIAANLTHYINSFSPKAAEIFRFFSFEQEIAKLDEANRLYGIVQMFAEFDFHPDSVSNIEMGYIFEELIRRYNEEANETAGDHFTPREVIRLMVSLLFSQDDDILTQKGIVKTIFDPACGTGGMLSVSEEYLRKNNPDAVPKIFGQDYNNESYAVCGSDMLIKGLSLEHIFFGDSLGNGKTKDGFPNQRFDYMLANPPFGQEWKPEEEYVRKEYQTKGFDGRFGAGLPRINDGSFLFLQHMISKMKPEGSRIGIVFNASPLFTGDASSGESNIRRWIIENDWLEAIIALPDQLFYNTGIFTYIWIVTNRKSPERRGKIQLIHAVDFYQKMRKSLGQKRHEISEEQIAQITRIYGDFAENEHCKIFDNEDFGYRKITVERPLQLSFQALPERIEVLCESTAFQNLAKSRKKGEAAQPEIEAGEKLQRQILKALKRFDADKVYKNRDLFQKDLLAACKAEGIKLEAPIRKAVLAALCERDETADICTDSKGNPEPDTELRDYENVPLKEDIYEYFKREVLPHVPDAWIDESKTKIGYEIPFNRHFYKYTPPRPLEEIEADIRAVELDIMKMLSEVSG